MYWENKVKMIQLGNNRDESKESKEEFQKYVLENIKTFDTQAWDMFAELSDLIPEQMQEDKAYWTEIYNNIKNVDCSSEKFGFRGAMRVALIQTIYEDHLALS